MTAKRQSNVRTGADAPVGRAAIYARISLDKVGEAAGVGRQIDGCRHLAELEGWSIDEVLVDNDLSAYSGACRPEYERLLDLVRRRRDPDGRGRARRPQHGERPVHRPGARGSGRARVRSDR
jgi:Resolvase, N terminal domain